MVFLNVARAAAFALAAAAWTTAAGAQNKAPDTVQYGSSGVFPSPLPVDDVTFGMGAFKVVEQDFHTTIKRQAMAAGPTAMAALLGGSIDYLVASGNAFGRAVAQGQPVVGLMELSESFTGALVAPTKFADRGTGLDALKKFNGGTWGVASAGGIAEFGARTAAEAAGLNWKAQNVIYTGSSAATASAVAAGRLDIGQPDLWLTSTLVARKQGAVILNLADLNDPIWAHQINWMLVTRKDTIEKYPDLTRAMVRAQLEGLLKSQDMRGNPELALTMYPSNDPAAVPPEAFRAYWTLSVPTFEKVSGVITPDALRDTAEILRRAGAFKPDQQIPADAVDNSFVEAAYKALGKTPAK